MGLNSIFKLKHSVTLWKPMKMISVAYTVEIVKK